MATSGAKFTVTTTKRIVNATRWAERVPKSDEAGDHGSPSTPDGLFPVLVVEDDDGGENGTYVPATNTGTFAAWTYDLYPIYDTAHEHKLNDDAVEPLRSAARVTIGPVNRAPDDTPGVAFYDADGNIQLWDCQETVGTEACSS